jgi:hypothetical protein
MCSICTSVQPVGVSANQEPLLSFREELLATPSCIFNLLLPMPMVDVCLGAYLKFYFQKDPYNVVFILNAA